MHAKSKGANLGLLRKREVLRMRPINCASWVGGRSGADFPALNPPDSKGGYENSLASFYGGVVNGITCRLFRR